MAVDATLYGVLGVERSADERDIVRAYREMVKTHHPDVSDAPDARAQFKRIRTAKEVLTDGDQRARYDRLGHETYVRRCLDPELWAVSTADGVATGDTSADATGAASVHTGDGASAGAATSVSGGAGESARAASGPTAQREATQRQYRADGAGTATAYYRPGERLGVGSAGTGRRFADALLEVGPWLVAHLLLFLSAATVATLLLTGGSDGGLPSLTSVVVATVMVGLTACLSLLHVTSTLFR